MYVPVVHITHGFKLDKPVSTFCAQFQGIFEVWIAKKEKHMLANKTKSDVLLLRTVFQLTESSLYVLHVCVCVTHVKLGLFPSRGGFE